MIDYAPSIDGLKGKDNLSGLKQTVYVAPARVFDSLKGLKTGAAIVGPGDSVTIDGSHTFIATEGFTKLYTTYDTAQMMIESAKNRDQSGGPIKLEAFHPGSHKEAAEFFRHTPTDEFIVLVEDTNNDPVTGKPYIFQIGQKDLYASVRANYDSKNLTGDRKGFACTIEAFACGLMYYEGTITLKP